MNANKNFRVRFRFRLRKKLGIQHKKYEFEIDSKTVTLSPQTPDLNICESEWLVINGSGFKSKSDAIEFAEKLKLVCEISSVSSRIGVDSGLDIATSGFGEIVREHFEQQGIIPRDNIHGVDIFEDNSNIRFININGNVSVFAASEPFLGDISLFFESICDVSRETKDTILLLNYALMRPDPVAQIVFSISAVEMLGQSEDWSSNQKELINQLSISCNSYGIGTEVERAEVADAISKGLFKLSLRQGVMRLLAKLDLMHLKKQWDLIYSKRCTLIHGLAPTPGVDYGSFANEVVNLCGYILLTSISKEIPEANKHISKFYSL